MWWGKARALRFSIHFSLNSFFLHSALRLYALMLFSDSVGALSIVVAGCYGDSHYLGKPH
jgi:hypothetical protein